MEILYGIIALLIGIIIFQQWSHHKQQTTLLKAILSKDVNDFKFATETPKSTGKPTDELVPLDQLSDEEYDKLVLHAKP